MRLKGSQSKFRYRRRCSSSSGPYSGRHFFSRGQFSQRPCTAALYTRVVSFRIARVCRKRAINIKRCGWDDGEFGRVERSRSPPGSAPVRNSSRGLVLRNGWPAGADVCDQTTLDGELDGEKARFCTCSSPGNVNVIMLVPRATTAPATIRVSRYSIMYALPSNRV